MTLFAARRFSSKPPEDGDVSASTPSFFVFFVPVAVLDTALQPLVPLFFIQLFSVLRVAIACVLVGTLASVLRMHADGLRRRKRFSGTFIARLCHRQQAGTGRETRHDLRGNLHA
jgi:hypothetical protein